jgi:hypothetical protein
VVGDDGPADHRARLHLARADALTLDGDFAAARATYRAAAADAETVGDGELLCRAALGFSGPTSSMWVEWGSHDVELESLLDRADLALGPVPTPLRARLLAARAAHLAVVDPREADRWSAAALAMAESLRDQAAERAALVGRRMAVWRPDALDERLRLDDRLVDLADGHPRAEFDGLGFLLMDLVEAGRMEEADDVADRIDRIGAELDWGFPRWNALRYRAMRLGMGGHLDEVLAVAGEALAAGQSANPENAAGSYGAVLLAVGFHRAEVTGLADSLQSLADAQPRMSPYSAAVPFYLAEEGRMDEAGEAVAALGARLDEVRLGPDWLSTMCLFAYAVHAAGDRAVAEDLLARLGPFGGLHATVGGIVFTLGPTDRYLGLLSETVGDVTAADVHFDAARARAGELGCPLYGALTLVEQGRCLRAAGLDPGRSDDLLSAAAELAADLDLPLVRRKLDQVEEAA